MKEDRDAIKKLVGLAAKEVTLAEVLSESGYNTVHIGKWHMGDIQEAWPNYQGFDYAAFPIHQQGQLTVFNDDATAEGVAIGKARERILDIASTQFADGSAYHQYQPLTKRGNDAVGSNFNDDPLWLILGVADVDHARAESMNAGG